MMGSIEYIGGRFQSTHPAAVDVVPPPPPLLLPLAAVVGGGAMVQDDQSISRCGMGVYDGPATARGLGAHRRSPRHAASQQQPRLGNPMAGVLIQLIDGSAACVMGSSIDR